MTYAIAVALTVSQQHPVQSADRLPNGHELSCVALPDPSYLHLSSATDSAVYSVSHIMGVHVRNIVSG